MIEWKHEDQKVIEDVEKPICGSECVSERTSRK
jgi:hypothetical protein